MKIILYTIPYEVPNEGTKINHLFSLGLEELHLRKPKFSKREYVDLIRSIDEKHRDKIVIHSHFNLASKFKLRGIHVEEDFFHGLLGGLRSLKFKKSDLQISTTVNRLKGSLRDLVHFNSIFLGPLFHKYSEENIKSNFDGFELKNCIDSIKTDVYAIGGIDLNTKKKIQHLGFDGVALQSCIWKSDDLINAFNAFKISEPSEGSNSSRIKLA